MFFLVTPKQQKINQTSRKSIKYSKYNILKKFTKYLNKEYIKKTEDMIETYYN